MYEAAVKYIKEEKKVTEKYIVDAITPSDAENKLIENLCIQGEFDITFLRKSKYSEFIKTDGDSIFSVTSTVTNIDGKVSTMKHLVRADEVKKALKEYEKYMMDSDYTIVKIELTKIKEVYENS